MAFEFTDRHVKDYHELGYTIFREILPTALLTDLRREAAKGRAIARQRSGENAQRLQPIRSFPELDPRPFNEYHALPALDEALHKLFDDVPGYDFDRAEFAPRSLMGILYEPAGHPWCTAWHRDWRDNIRGLDIRVWEERMLDPRLFVQVNCALYADSCTWVVPGSHLRRDTPSEAARFPDRPILAPELEGLSAEEQERTCLEYARRMPGGVQVHLGAGDYLLYRNTLWHLGNYTPWARRETLHDGVITPAFKEWFDAPPYLPKKENGETADWMNPNTLRHKREAVRTTES